VLGQVAPEFQLRDEDGNNVTLRRLLRTGPVLMHHYRGNW
jgi:peroxiredoxin